MMQVIVRRWVEQSLRRHGVNGGDVLEVGSRDINGRVSDLFADECWRYIGLDRIDGPNVNFVGEVADLPPQSIFDLILCLDTLEHDPNPIETVAAMRGRLRPEGLIVLAAPMVWGVHDYPGDYWRFMPEAFERLFLAGFENIEVKTMAAGGGRVEVLGRGIQPKDMAAGHERVIPGGA